MTDPSQIRDVYSRNAETYDARRTRALHEARWLRMFAAHLPEGGRVLDLGCGTGRPIGGWLIGEGFELTGTDFAEPMLAIARKRLPEADWRLVDMREIDLGETFHGVIGWDSFFHLTPAEQKACVPRIADHLRPGGVLLLTVGPKAGEVTGQIANETVYHASLSAAEYAVLLEDCGLRMIAYQAEDPDCAYHSVLMARRDE